MELSWMQKNCFQTNNLVLEKNHLLICILNDLFKISLRLKIKPQHCIFFTTNMKCNFLDDVVIEVSCQKLKNKKKTFFPKKKNYYFFDTKSRMKI